MKKSRTLPPLRIDDDINFFIDRIMGDVERNIGKVPNLSQLRRCFYLVFMKSEACYKKVLAEVINLLKYKP